MLLVLSQVADDAEDIRKEVGCLTLLRNHPTIARLKDTFEDRKVRPHRPTRVL